MTKQLDFVLSFVRKDERTYLEVSVYSVRLLGLLDSGAKDVIIGRKGWKLCEPFCKLDVSRKRSFKVANGQDCDSLGSVTIPISL